MRIPGAALRTPITIEPALGNLGDGDTYGPAETVKAAVKATTKVTGDAAGQTLAVWATLRLRPDVTVTGAAGARPPAPGDRVTVHGHTRTLASVEAVHGPGASVAFLELVAGQ